MIQLAVCAFKGSSKKFFFKNSTLLVEVLVSLLQVKQDLLCAFHRWCVGDSFSNTLQKLSEQGLELGLVLRGKKL